MKKIIIALILFIFLTPVALAVEAEELLKNQDLTDSERNAIARAIAKDGQKSNILPTTLKGILEWQEMGDAFATTIERVCQTLRIEVNEFLKSEVGMLVAAVIIYKMVGQDVLRISLYTMIWLGVTFIIGFSIKFLHMKKMVKQLINDPSDDKKQIVSIVPMDRFGWEDTIVKNFSLCIHMIAWFVFTCIVAYNII